MRDYRMLADEYGTPFYLFDEKKIRERIFMLRNILGEKVRLCFAMKANPMLTKKLNGLVDCFEVCSPGEFRITEKAGISREKIVLSGVYKEKEDIRRVIGQYGNRGIFTVESETQLHLLEELARGKQTVLKVLLRLSSGNQFGMDEGTIRRIISERRNLTGLEITGLQMYGGTQRKKTDPIRKELTGLKELISELKEKHGFETGMLEYGPGLGVEYFEGGKEQGEEKLLRELESILRELEFPCGITLEMGRFLCASCGVYVTKIADVKVNGGRKYCICDGGINHLNYYGQTLAMQVPCMEHISRKEKISPDEEKNGGCTEKVTLCGALCTAADILVRDISLQDPSEGDILVFENTGAYSGTESRYLFLSRDLPAVLFAETDKEGGEIIVPYRKHTETDALNYDGN